jgi:hypothetical protein
MPRALLAEPKLIGRRLLFGLFPLIEPRGTEPRTSSSPCRQIHGSTPSRSGTRMVSSRKATPSLKASFSTGRGMHTPMTSSG